MKTGPEVIRRHLTNIPHSPGVYRMLDQRQKVLYVGKAKDLVKRLSNYLQLDGLTERIRHMVMMTADLEIIATKTETEALLLEADLIKNMNPRYNILLRDGKTFPYIVITDNHEFGRILKYRGRKPEGHYFGPFASVQDVDSTITFIQKTFKIRSCSDAYFASRKRPCILHQIKRCSAPCVGKISQQDYVELVKEVEDFLSGRTVKLREKLGMLMEEASEKMEYELAAVYRDRLKSIAYIQNKHSFSDITGEDADIIAIYQDYGEYCVQIFFLRNGQNYGNNSFFPANTEDSTSEDVLTAFLMQFYQTHTPPSQIVLNVSMQEQKEVSCALTKIAGYPVRIDTAQKFKKHNFMQLAENNAKLALKRRSLSSLKHHKLAYELKQTFDLEQLPQRIEVYDNSHIMGKNAVGAMIVVNEQGFDKNSYRKFNIKTQAAELIKGGDDYAMLEEMLLRRFKRLLKECPSYIEGEWPDFILIDGGVGQFNVAKRVFAELGLQDLNFATMAKGPDRNAGKEYFISKSRKPFDMDSNSPLMRYLQIIRDESHRFAIKTHRLKRSATLTTSGLEHIPGVGDQRKKTLLNYFGSIKAIEEAQIEELAKVDNIGTKVAKVIYHYLHPSK